MMPKFGKIPKNNVFFLCFWALLVVKRKIEALNDRRKSCNGGTIKSIHFPNRFLSFIEISSLLLEIQRPTFGVTGDPPGVAGDPWVPGRLMVNGTV